MDFNDHLFRGQQYQDPIEVDNRKYWLVPAVNENTSHLWPRTQKTDIPRYHSDELSKVKPYEYGALPKDQKRIRLLELKSGTPAGREIYCELFEVEYDDTFHIPVRVESKRAEQNCTIVEVSAESEIEQSYISPDEEEKRSKLQGWKDRRREKKATKEARQQMAREKFLQNESYVQENRVDYEALSWSWGGGDDIYAVFFLKNGEKYKKAVKKELALALKYLRLPDRPRILWIDTICMDQDNVAERNHQVQMMSRIYSRAREVCVWLGEDRPSTKMAFDFIRDDITHLKNFDTICSHKRYSPKWQALMQLMQAEWFFRRWVVQEIAFASKATVYCGPNSIPWADFAVAVELFVEVETATHRLSEIMQKDEKFRHVNGWFEHVSELGASLLVQASGKVFRATKMPLPNTSSERNQRKDMKLDEPSSDEETEPDDESDEDSDEENEVKIDLAAHSKVIGSNATEDGGAPTYPEDIVPIHTVVKETAGKGAPGSSAILKDQSTNGETKERTTGKEVVSNAGKQESEETKTAEELVKMAQDKLIYKRMHDVRTVDPLKRRSLLSLEYLVSTMFIFRATEPRDVVYSLIAIARDATPFADAILRYDDRTSLVLTLLNSFLEEKPFFVDYKRPYSDVCRDFVQFVVRRKHKLDPIQALDILCRPWALEPGKGTSSKAVEEVIETERAMPPRKKAWQIRKSKIKWSEVEGKWRYSIVKYRRDEWIQDPDCPADSDLNAYMENYMNNSFNKPEWRPFDGGPAWCRPGGWDEVKRRSDEHKRRKSEAKKKRQILGDKYEGEVEQDVQLPSWVARASQAPFGIYEHPGMDAHKAGRAYADPLVGSPADGHRNYNAAQTKGLDLKDLKFCKRPERGHYSLYVKGFILDEVEEVRDASQGGMIPRSWLTMAGWDEPFDTDPPDALWRTLVADRGRDNKNSPYYFARACKESVRKGGVLSGSVNTAALINSEQNSIVAEFCRRVQAVVWNRYMFKTRKGQLGLATKVAKGDKVCIVYGCTVPVILTQCEKKPGERAKEEFEDQWESLKFCIQRMETNRLRKAKNRRKILQYRETGEWYEMMQHRKKAEDKLHELAEKDAKPRKRQSSSRADEGAEADPKFKKMKRRPTKVQEKRQEALEKDPELFYTFNGECYVHGLMDGEAMRTQFYRGEPNRSFELR